MTADRSVVVTSIGKTYRDNAEPRLVFFDQSNASRFDATMTCQMSVRHDHV